MLVVGLVVLVVLSMSVRILVIHVWVVGAVVGRTISSCSSGEVVLGNTGYLILELRDELLTLSGGGRVRVGPMERLLKELVIHAIVLGREVNRFHFGVEPVAGTQLPLPESRKTNSRKPDDHCNDNDCNQSRLADSRRGRRAAGRCD